MKYIIFLLLSLPTILFSQEQLTGVILEVNEKNESIGIPGANVYWLDTSIGTITEIDGNFTIPYNAEHTKLVISYVGYKTDTLTVKTPKPIRHVLHSNNSLDEVTIRNRRKSSSLSYLTAENVTNVSSDELLKAACCNLSESFETNPSIDVNFADAVSGARQIKMLGLTSPYILIATENIPSIRGAAQTYGLSFIPGTWVESIQITKGAGSVTNGFESIAGQINAELQKPTTDDKLFVNLYGATNERFEINTHLNTKVSDKWSTGLYLHGNNNDGKHDENNDGFLDMPMAQQINVMNRWQYTNLEKGFVSFLNFRYLNDEKETGQLGHILEDDGGNTGGHGVDDGKISGRAVEDLWISETKTERYDISAKLGYVNPEIPYQTAGLQVAFSNHVQESYFGLKTYDITHRSLYSNVVYNSIISDSRHKVKTGVGYTHDDYIEWVNGTEYSREENSVGGFFEYTYDNLGNLNLTAGVRLDHHNLLGTFLTPRLHARFTPWGKSALRGSIGRGKRSANIFSENQSMFSTARTISILSTGGSIYGLDPEIAWNYGVSFLQGFNLFERKADITFDFYRTDFQNQVVVDREDRTQVRFYNLAGESFANSFQVEFNINVLDRLDLRTAYKFYDIQTDYRSGRLEKPLTPSHRIFANVFYETEIQPNGSQWKFDMTYNWLGEQRFSKTSDNPVPYQLPEYSPTVGTLNAQITNVLSHNFELYFGGENITDVRQNNPIIASQDPFGPNFDTTFVYGPIFGSMYYAGLRFRLN
ncbi:outer membrane receptor protein involved in Fe transport [Ulvibacter sp. MAR_2010_11]|uniref:TonB-dependent receptor n=1 Tax=Ulvibacter sp. MAR_2010_11 TaxID=1250229 RepID=UPI000C2BA473|nr:carboxypeptidase-like regulatory domain-containing protein [Ulvibacter sp. MAR_2010_11]PKA82485.1 outer membrane receptor protein involved in Fe transport [Ulvibacter sp. MAR_2010_11]